VNSISKGRSGADVVGSPLALAGRADSAASRAAGGQYEPVGASDCAALSGHLWIAVGFPSLEGCGVNAALSASNSVFYRCIGLG
jgi:hypothetical protein